MSFMKGWTTGHPKVDPESQEILLFHCTFLPLYVNYSVIPPAYHNSPTSQCFLNFSTLQSLAFLAPRLHDFGVSRTHTIIIDLPLSLDIFSLIKNNPVISYDCAKPSCFRVFSRRNPTKVRWLETSACYIFHTAHAWDTEDVQGNTTAWTPRLSADV